MEIIQTVQGWGTIRLEAVEERSPEVMTSVWEMVLRSSVGSWSRGRYQEVSESWLLAISNSFLQLICPILFPFYRHCPQTSSVHQSHQCFVQLQHDIPYFIQFLSLSKHASNALFITRLTCATTFRELWTCTPRSLSLYIDIPQVPIIYSPCPARI